jgi:hypothetical protein
MKRRPIARLPESLEKILRSYAVAAGAAGMGVLASAQLSEAKIIYKPLHMKLVQRVLFDLRFDGGVAPDFTLEVDGYYGSFLVLGSNYGSPPNEVWEAPDTRYAAALHAGIKLGPKGNFKHAHGSHRMATWVVTSSSGFLSFGPWRNVKNRYLGLKFFVNGEAHYGWARLTVHIYSKPPKLKALVTGYAYETIANKPITTGDTGTVQDTSLIKPFGDDLAVTARNRASLGLLAAGARALPVWRQDKSVALKP